MGTLLSVAMLNQCLYFTKLAIAPRKVFDADFRKAATFSGFSVFPLTLANGSVAVLRLMASWPEMKSMFTPLGVMCINIALVLQLGGMAWFCSLARSEDQP